MAIVDYHPISDNVVEKPVFTKIVRLHPDHLPHQDVDFDGVAWWEVRNLGFGEQAARDNARAQIQQARMREVETLDLVAREVVEAHAQVAARKRQIAVAQEGITAAQQSYERNLNRIRNVQGLPIEVLQSIQALDTARREYLRAVVDYNTAQFRLQRPADEDSQEQLILWRSAGKFHARHAPRDNSPLLNRRHDKAKTVERMFYLISPHTEHRDGAARVGNSFDERREFRIDHLQ
jgi:BMFP domain-containing protein YqiC